MSDHGESKAMQRVRVGLTGLACVFLLVMLAAVFLRATGEQVETTHNAIAAASSNGTATPNEPLAQLGVAPGNVPSATPATPAANAPRPPARR